LFDRYYWSTSGLARLEAERPLEITDQSVHTNPMLAQSSPHEFMSVLIKTLQDYVCSPLLLLFTVTVGPTALQAPAQVIPGSMRPHPQNVQRHAHGLRQGFAVFHF
jgi:hypothetical protein